MANTDLIFECPCCHGLCVVSATEVNCRIFRHLATPDGQPAPAHASKEECRNLLSRGARGCGAAFRLDENGVPHVCDYD